MAHETYLTYTEYVSMGGTQPQTAFDLLELKARKRIDYLTASRVQDMADVPRAVKLCIMGLMEMDSKVGAEAQASKPVVTSFSTDGYSENYGSRMGVNEAEHNMNAVVTEYLYGEKDDNGVPLLYRGVDW